jgi:hypothetical protein
MKQILYLSAAAVLMAGGCASMSNTLGDAAYRLDRSAGSLYDEVRDDSGRSSGGKTSLERDAGEFSKVADEFHRDVQQRKATDDLRDQFDVVAGHYHELRDEFGEVRPSARERTAFNDVTRAYLDLERELQYSGAGDRYRYRRDR